MAHEFYVVFFFVCVYNLCFQYPSFKKKFFRALIFLNRVSSIIILRLISLALLWCQLFYFDRNLDFYS